MSKNIRLQFSDHNFEVLLLDGNIVEQIRLYLKNHTNKRGRIAISHNGEHPRYSSLNNNDSIDAFIVADNASVSDHIVAQGFNPNYFAICGNIAVPSHLPIIDV